MGIRRLTIADIRHTIPLEWFDGIKSDARMCVTKPLRGYRHDGFYTLLENSEMVEFQYFIDPEYFPVANSRIEMRRTYALRIGFFGANEFIDHRFRFYTMSSQLTTLHTGLKSIGEARKLAYDHYNFTISDIKIPESR